VPDRYTYPDSDVLINRFGITDYEHWTDLETEVIGQRMIEATAHPIPGSYDLAHLARVHRGLAGDLYVWAGEIRDTDTHPGGTGIVHCRPPFITGEAERVFDQLAREHYLRGLDADAFSDRLAWVWGEITTIHPFRDVNTRTQHVFFNHLARDAGWVVDWSKIPGDLMAHARTLAIVEDHSGIDALIRPNLLNIEHASHIDRLLDRMAEHERGFLTRHASRDPETLDSQLDAARERRRNLPDLGLFGRDRPQPDAGRSGPSRGL